MIGFAVFLLVCLTGWIVHLVQMAQHYRNIAKTALAAEQYNQAIKRVSEQASIKMIECSRCEGTCVEPGWQRIGDGPWPVCIKCYGEGEV